MARSEANQRAVVGLQAVAKRRMEIMRQATTEAANVARRASAAGSHGQLPKQSELPKQAFEQAIVNMREPAETMQKSTHEAFDVVNRRISASLDELKDRITPKLKKRRS
ncbi:MAG TPA: TIGR01841 family phasin [Steroidobacteraceae bacterium]|nr:TIGR01841 family phasin [Steroidobacteraceae bacterium]